MTEETYRSVLDRHVVASIAPFKGRPLTNEVIVEIHAASRRAVLAADLEFDFGLLPEIATRLAEAIWERRWEQDLEKIVQDELDQMDVEYEEKRKWQSS